jgi:hypothetical protein
MLETGTSGSVGGEGGNILAYPAIIRGHAQGRKPCIRGTDVIGVYQCASVVEYTFAHGPVVTQ